MKKHRGILGVLLLSILIFVCLAGICSKNFRQDEPIETVDFSVFQEEVEEIPYSNQVSLEKPDISQVQAQKIVVCIDPGHFKDASVLEGENLYDYQEGIFTLSIALSLRDELAKYGIESYLTRETDDITIDGFTNKELDKKHLSLRGEAAKDADFFVSLHTNANKDDANGYDTCSQPVEINKTILILNQIACKEQKYIDIANELGQAITNVNYEKGISYSSDFRQIEMTGITEWTSDYNDSLNTPGTVFVRTGEDGDFYGVLRGASNVGVAGIIIEHGFHTIEELRRLAMQDDLALEYAKADAYAIAKGFGLIKE